MRSRMKSVWSRAVDDGRLLGEPDLGVLHRGLVVGADDVVERLPRLGLGHALRDHHPLDQRLELVAPFLDQALARREHAVGVARAVDVGAVGEHDRARHVVQQRRGVRLDRADPVERPGLERLDRLGRVGHVAHDGVGQRDAVGLQPVVGHDLERVELEGAERLADELLGAVEPGLGDDGAALDAAAGDDLDRRARVEQRDEARVRHEPDIHLADAEERSPARRRSAC